MSSTNQEKRIIARAVMKCEDKILLAYNKKDSFYFLPGGRVDAHESCISALKREIEEEIYLSASVMNEPTAIGMLENVWNDRGVDVYELIVCFEIKLDLKNNLKAPESRENHLSFHFLSAKEINRVDFRPRRMKRLVDSAFNANGMQQIYYPLGGEVQ